MAAMGKRERNERGIKNEGGKKGQDALESSERCGAFKVACVSISDTELTCWSGSRGFPAGAGGTSEDEKKKSSLRPIPPPSAEVD